MTNDSKENNYSGEYEAEQVISIGGNKRRRRKRKTRKKKEENNGLKITKHFMKNLIN